MAPSDRGPARKPTELARHVLIPSGAQGLATARTCGHGRLPGADLDRLRQATGGPACSAKCRAALNRQRRAEGRELRDREILALLDRAEQLEARAAELRTQARARLHR
jgi:hypothetical protein